jgi:hypothetical protein
LRQNPDIELSQRAQAEAQSLVYFHPNIPSYNAYYRTVKRVLCYAFGMSRDTQALLEAFEHLPAEEKRAFTDEVLRRSLPFDSGPLADEEVGIASDALWQSLDEEDGDTAAR